MASDYKKIAEETGGATAQPQSTALAFYWRNDNQPDEIRVDR